MPEIFFKEECYTIIGVCMKVHTTLGKGFLEAVYHEALKREFEKNKIPYKSEVRLEVFYGDEKLNKYYKADFICYDKIVLEIKSMPQLAFANYQQTQNYLQAIRYPLGILVNFGENSLTYKRILNTKIVGK